MIRSMTAYARREIKGDWGSAAWGAALGKPALSGTRTSACRSSSVVWSPWYASAFAPA